MKLIHVKSKRVKIGNLCQYLLLFPQRRQLFTIFAQYPSFLPICTGDNPLLQSIYAHCTRTASAAIPCIFIVEATDENAPGRKKRWEGDTAKVIWGPGDQ